MVSENTAPTGDEVTQAVPPAGQPEPEGEGQQRTFSQEEMNRIQAQTRKEVRNQFADYGQLKDRAARADELEQAQLTEKERLEARVEQAEKNAQAADQRITEAMIATAVQVQASQMGIVDPEAAFLLVDRANIRYTAETGVAGVADALTQLLESKPYLKGPNRTPNINPEGSQADAPIRLTAEQRDAAKYLGMTEDQYAKGL